MGDVTRVIAEVIYQNDRVKLHGMLWFKPEEFSTCC